MINLLIVIRLLLLVMIRLLLGAISFEFFFSIYIYIYIFCFIILFHFIFFLNFFFYIEQNSSVLSSYVHGEGGLRRYFGKYTYKFIFNKNEKINGCRERFEWMHLVAWA